VNFITKQWPINVKAFITYTVVFPDGYFTGWFFFSERRFQERQFPDGQIPGWDVFRKTVREWYVIGGLVAVTLKSYRTTIL